MIALRISVELSKGGVLDHKELEKDRGFLVYIISIYRSMVPYLKIIHQTLDSWRPGRNTDGWRLSREELRELYAGTDHKIGGDAETLSNVHAVPRLKGDLFALEKLTVGNEPYQDPVRVSISGLVGYGMGDTSENRFGVAFYINDALLFRYGQWTSAISRASSNCKELKNLLEAMETHVRNGNLRDCEVFLLTDNLVAGYAFYKDISSSETLFKLILRLIHSELESDIILHMIHVSGKRMIASGVDALSRENTTMGIIRVNSLLFYFSFHLGADQRSSELVPWINSFWTGEEWLVHLSPDGWFDNVFAEGNYL